MDEGTLNNTVTVAGDKHVGGFVLLERIGERCWRACDWSAFYARLVLPENCCKSYRNNSGFAVTEFSANGVFVLSERLELLCLQAPDMMLFGVWRRLTIPEVIFRKWKNELPAESALKNRSKILQMSR